MHAWEQIQITIDYIEDHIAEDINIEDLAKRAALSQFYYQHLFTRLVKKPVNEYIKLRRLAKASEALHDKSKRIIDIALDNGFSSHEVFSRAFKTAFGMTPEQYRNNPVQLNNFIKPQLMLNYTLVDENVPLITEEIVIEISRCKLESPQYFLGYTVEEPVNQMPGQGGTGIDTLGLLWDRFHEQKPRIPMLKKDGDELGVAFMGTREGYYRYFAGGEAESEDTVEGMDRWILEKGEYIICTFEAENFEKLVMDAIYKAQNYLYNTWLPNHNLTSKPFAIERYASHGPDTTKMEVWVMPQPIS
jgi:AraC family transcriptional regulator